MTVSREDFAALQEEFRVLKEQFTVTLVAIVARKVRPPQQPTVSVDLEDDLLAFIGRCHDVPGAFWRFGDFHAAFVAARGSHASKADVRRAMERLYTVDGRYPYGTKHSNQKFIGNLAAASAPAGERLILTGDKLKPASRRSAA